MSSTVSSLKVATFSVSIQTVTAIDAPAAAVWGTLTDFASYPSWNPFIKRLRGALTLGERLEVDLLIPGKKVQSMRPRVTEYSAGRSFVWLGRIGPRGIFDGRHRFEVISTGAASCELHQSEKLTGLMIPFFKGMLTGPTVTAFASLNEAIKDRVEA